MGCCYQKGDLTKYNFTLQSGVKRTQEANPNSIQDKDTKDNTMKTKSLLVNDFSLATIKQHQEPPMRIINTISENSFMEHKQLENKIRFGAEDPPEESSFIKFERALDNFSSFKDNGSSIREETPKGNYSIDTFRPGKESGNKLNSSKTLELRSGKFSKYKSFVSKGENNFNITNFNSSISISTIKKLQETNKKITHVNIGRRGSLTNFTLKEKTKSDKNVPKVAKDKISKGISTIPLGPGKMYNSEKTVLREQNKLQNEKDVKFNKVSEVTLGKYVHIFTDTGRQSVSHSKSPRVSRQEDNGDISNFRNLSLIKSRKGSSDYNLDSLNSSSLNVKKFIGTSSSSVIMEGLT